MLRLPAVALLAASLLFWGFYDRYEPAGPVLLQSPALADATRMWGDCHEEAGRFVLNVELGGKTAGILFHITDAQRFDHIRVRGRIKVSGVETGKYNWSCARLVLGQYDAADKWIGGHHAVATIKGSHDWAPCVDEFSVDEKTSRVNLSLQQLGSAGKAEFDRIIVEPVRIRASLLWWQVLFAGLWMAWGVLYFRRCRLHCRRLRLLILLNTIAIIIGVMIPDKWLEGTIGYAQEEAAKVVDVARQGVSPPSIHSTSSAQGFDRPEIVDQFIDLVGGGHGVGHFVLFATLCFLVYLSVALEHQPRSYFVKVALDISLFAAVTESLQYLTYDRTPSIDDWFVDVFGMALALVFFIPTLLALRLVQRKKERFVQ